MGSEAGLSHSFPELLAALGVPGRKSIHPGTGRFEESLAAGKTVVAMTILPPITLLLDFIQTSYLQTDTCSHSSLHVHVVWCVCMFFPPGVRKRVETN